MVIRSQRIVTPTGMAPGTVVISSGIITEVGGPERAADLLSNASSGGSAARIQFEDVGDLVVMPGLVDTHVHVNEPGRTAWEGYASATRAAAAGGITTLVDMPLNSIPATTTVDALAEKRAAADGQCAIDVGFWGGVVPGNRDQLRAMIDAGVMGFKCFLIDSGVEEFAHVGAREAREALAILGEAGVPLLVHAELSGPIDAVAAEIANADPTRYSTYLASRPPSAEEQAIALMVELCRETGAPVHIVHHSAASALSIVEAARNDGLPLSAETCPHYLHFAAEDIDDRATEFKCAPPIRERDNREALWRALSDGVLDMVVSDHSPCTVALKRREAGDFMRAWGGVSSLQITLPVVWTNARARGVRIADLSRWMCARPARLAGLTADKGALVAGKHADIAIWNPEAEYAVSADHLEHKNKVTPYHGETLWGVVEKTYVRGRCVFDRNASAARDSETSPAYGQFCRRSSSQSSA